MKNVKLNQDGTISYNKNGVTYTTIQTIHELAKGKTVIIKAKKVSNKQMGDKSITIIQGK